MALQGITLSTFFAWLTGLILLDRPFGQPTFNSWFSLPTLMSLLNFLISLFFLLDLYLNFPDADLRINSSKTKSPISLFINRATFYEFMCSSLLIIFIYKVQAKKLARLWGELYTRNLDDAKKLRFFVGNRLGFLISTVTYLVMLVVLISEGVETGANYDKSWISFVGRVPYSILTVCFRVSPMVMPSGCGFASVLTTLHHIRWVYSRYCQNLHDLMVEQARSSKSKGARRIVTPDVKEDMYQELLKIQQLFDLVDEVVGPLVLVILSGGTLRLVLLSAKFVFYHGTLPSLDDEEAVVDAALLFITVGYLYLLEDGEKMLSLFSDWKAKLRALTLDLPVKACHGARDANDLYLMIDNWEWRLTAWRFFDVDRKLVSGIMSLLLTYSVILFQIRLAVEGS